MKASSSSPRFSARQRAGVALVVCVWCACSGPETPAAAGGSVGSGSSTSTAGSGGASSGTDCTFPNDPVVCGCGNACVGDPDAPDYGTCRTCGAKGSGCPADDIICCSDADCPAPRRCSAILAEPTPTEFQLCSTLDPCTVDEDCLAGETCYDDYCRDAVIGDGGGGGGSGGVCGDSACAAAETCATCPEDCGACGASCGDGTCDPGETCAGCPTDCGDECAPGTSECTGANEGSDCVGGCWQPPQSCTSYCQIFPGPTYVCPDGQCNTSLLCHDELDQAVCECRATCGIDGATMCDPTSSANGFYCAFGEGQLVWNFATCVSVCQNSGYSGTYGCGPTPNGSWCSCY
jgi:hypothetical protein